MASMIQSIIQFINQPFPEEDNSKKYYLKLTIISLFVSLFILLFKPFGLHRLGNLIWTYSIIFGLITLLSSIVYDLVIKRIFKVEYTGPSFTLWKWLLTTLGLILFISISNYVFVSTTINDSGLSLWNMIYATFIIGIFPIAFIGSLTVVAQSSKHQKIANDFKRKYSPHENDDRKKELIHYIPIENILFIEAKQNYVDINYIDNNELKIETIRSTLTAIEKLSNKGLTRCHRSFLVNLDKILSIKGNAQGLKLTLNYGDLIVPVSRKYISIFKNH